MKRVSMPDSWHEGATVDIGAEMRRLTLAMVGSALFGAELGSCAFRIGTVLDRVMRRSARIAPLLSLLEPALIRHRSWRPGASSLFFPKERRELEAIIAPLVAAHAGDAAAASAPGVMRQLLHCADLTPEDIRNELVTLVLAGHETTATALTWAWSLLARHPEVDERLACEVEQVTGGGPLSVEHIPQLRSKAQVFNETLRLYPPALAFGRRPIEPVDLGGYLIPRGASVLLSPYITQRNERFFPRPDRFDPDRWAGPEPPKFAYFPFGAGAKRCIGESLARMEGVLALAELSRCWRLRLIDNREIGIAAGVTLRPAQPICMRISARVAGSL